MSIGDSGIIISLVSFRQICIELSISTSTLERLSRNPRSQFPPWVYLGNRRFLARHVLEGWKTWFLTRQDPPDNPPQNPGDTTGETPPEGRPT